MYCTSNSVVVPSQAGRLARRADPQVPAVEQEIYAVLFQLNRVGVVFGDALHDFERRHRNLVAARGARIGLDAAGDDDAGLLRESPQRLENLRALLLRYHALDHSRAVTEDGKEQLTRFPQVVEPSAESDFPAHVLADPIDGHSSHLR